MFGRATLFLLFLGWLQAEVRVWRGTITLPTYEEGLPDDNPPFLFFHTADSEVYPYTIRNKLTLDQSRKTWRTLEIENEYLKCTVLPDLGGRIYSCIDKIGKHDLFYANPVLKKYPAGLRTAWIAAGTEFNFPVGHSWMTVSPVDFATAKNADGSGSIFVAATDRVYRMRWAVEITLRPGVDVLEERITLSNPSAVRHRYYWWNNAEIPAFEDTRFYLPCHVTSSHAHADLDSWPINGAGVDMSRMANHQGDGVARFGMGCREPFMGVYSPQDGAGTGHFADPAVVPGKKIWSWGSAKSRADTAKALTDNGSQYVELQAGLFEDQETYGFLDPQQTRSFNEYWMPLRGIGGLSRLTRDAAVHMERNGKDLTISLNAFRSIPKARVRVQPGFEETVDLDPAQMYRHVLPNVDPGVKYKFELLDSSGKVLLVHTEDSYSAMGLAEAKKLPETGLIKTATTETEFLEKGAQEEVLRDALTALETYDEGLAKFPASAALQRAAAGAALALNRFEETVERLRKSAPSAEKDYYLGIAYLNLGDDLKARTALAAWRDGSRLALAARFRLAELMARWGDCRNALIEVRKLIEIQHDPAGAGVFEVALLRHLGDKEEAARRLDHWLAQDASDPKLRFEAFKLGRPGDDLWPYLAADPQRVLDVATLYMRTGMYQDALEVLGHNYPEVDALQREPGDPLPQNDPLVGYYRAFCKLKAAQPAREDFDKASKMSTLYVFPNRPESFLVLQAALRENPSDATAHFLLGSLRLASGLPESARREWKAAYDLHGDFPGLHANLGRLLERAKDTDAALKVYQEGIIVDPRNQALQTGLQKAIEVKKTEVAAAAPKPNFFVEHAPAPVAKPEQMAQLALSMLEADRIGDAAGVFKEENFEKEKQSDAVRAAFVEVRLQTILDKAKQKKCDEALNLMETIGDEDPGLPFTIYGFGATLKSPRIQYELGVAEERCGNEKAARKRWSKAAKEGGGAWAALAAGKLDSAGSKARLEKALAALPETDAYSRGLILEALGRQKEAEESLHTASRQAGGDIMLNYLCQMALLGR
jgi:tetratricopeptide (TPR) repeat protein